MTKNINWDTTKTEMDLIVKIAERAHVTAKQFGVENSKQTFVMDLAATHCNGCRLNLAGLLAADNLNFSHDVFGIQGHINRSTGKLEDCFVPRFAMNQRSEKRHSVTIANPRTGVRYPY